MCDDRVLTYADLDARANRLACHLRTLGVGPGALVGLLLERSAEVYVGLLAILKAGAAYVPLDPDYPADRVADVLADCSAAAVVTASPLRPKLGSFAGTVCDLDADRIAIDAQPSERLPTTAGPDDLGYVIYTSGSTGRPKGVMVEHRSATHLVRAEAALSGVRPDDRVFQGFSIAFDASVEEVWAAFAAGAALVVGTRELMRTGPDLGHHLTALGVTVLSTVPTLLAVLDGGLPTVRVLILGGETCPAELVARWAGPGRTLWNTYGPTEATVIATAAVCQPGRPVTIGKPLPGYTVVLVDAVGWVAGPGDVGEILIGGVGVARGYVGRDDLTRERFVTDPAPNIRGRFYRTGDLARWTADGELLFLGRSDAQVKIRGYRVELGEIEAALMAVPGVRSAAAAVHTDAAGTAVLVGYVVPTTGPVPGDVVRSHLRTRLPAYMVPARFETVAGLPTMPSGKIDRSRLPAPRVDDRVSLEADRPRTELEDRVARVWAKAFGRPGVPVDDDFFLDLGGHSLLAARVVSELRAEADLRHAAVVDVYHHPTVARLAAHLATTRPAQAAPPAVGRTPGRSIPPLRHFLCGFGQFVALYAVLGFFSLQWVGPYIVYADAVDRGWPVPTAVAAALVSIVAVYPVMLALGVAAKWSLLGRVEPGRHPLWGWYYFRWWLAGSILAAAPAGYLVGTPLLAWYYRRLGAHIGANVYLGSDDAGAYDLLSIGDDTCVGADVGLRGSTVEGGFLHVGPITIGSGCTVGGRSVIMPGASVGDGATVGELSLVRAEQAVPAGERWGGSPARKIGGSDGWPSVLPSPLEVEATASADRAGVGGERGRAPSARETHGGWQAGAPGAPVDATPHPGPLRGAVPSPLEGEGKNGRPALARRFGLAILYAVGSIALPLTAIAAFLPGVIALNALSHRWPGYTYLLAAPLVAVSFVVLFALEVAAVKWLLLGRVRAGTYPRHGLFAARKWFVDRLMELSLDVTGPLYGTIYLNPWYRLLGVHVGRRAEVSTASDIPHDLLTLGDESFLADAVSVGGARVSGDTVTLAPVRLGRKAFAGNGSHLPPGGNLGDDGLLGCLSALPPGAATPGTGWVGSPAFHLPQRQESAAFPADRITDPPLRLWVVRGLIELVRVTLPATGLVVLSSLLITAAVTLRYEWPLWQVLLAFPVLYGVAGLGAALVVVAVKWAVAGRFRPTERPLWSPFVWRTELVSGVREYLADEFLVGLLKGTPFVCWYFRLLGAKIGRRVYLDTTDLCEFDLTAIGDEAELNDDCTLQTHLFEDRVMKVSAVTVGRGATVGGWSLILYDSAIGDGAVVEDLSLVMKGETLPAGTRWAGAPAGRAANGPLGGES